MTTFGVIVFLIGLIMIIKSSIKNLNITEEYNPAKAAYFYILEELYEEKAKDQIILDLMKKFNLDETEAKITYKAAIEHDFRYFRLFYPSYKQALDI